VPGQQVATGRRDPFDRFAQLWAAVAPLAAEHVAGEAFTVRPDQRDVRGGAEPESEALPTVDESAESC
jgi:hypothetical protein